MTSRIVATIISDDNFVGPPNPLPGIKLEAICCGSENLIKFIKTIQLSLFHVNILLADVAKFWSALAPSTKEVPAREFVR